MDRTSIRRARRRHAAGRARVVTAVLSAAAFLGLGFRMAAGAATTATTSATASTVTASTSTSSDQTSTVSSMSATPGSVSSSQSADTSSHGS